MGKVSFGAAIALWVLAGASVARADEVMVFAAASLKSALDEIGAGFERESGHRVVVSYAGSNQLAQQILAGAPADIFLSAATNWMDKVEAEGHLRADTRVDLLSNRLVLIAPSESTLPPFELTATTDLPAMLGSGYLAMGAVDAVPAGQYGKAALEALGLWQDLSDQVAQADNVRAALTLVARGEAPLGVVYASDVGASDQVKVLSVFPPEVTPKILYPAALLSQAADVADVQFFEHLRSPQAGEIFETYGFQRLP